MSTLNQLLHRLSILLAFTLVARAEDFPLATHALKPGAWEIPKPCATN